MFLFECVNKAVTVLRFLEVWLVMYVVGAFCCDAMTLAGLLQGHIISRFSPVPADDGCHSLVQRNCLILSM